MEASLAVIDLTSTFSPLRSAWEAYDKQGADFFGLRQQITQGPPAQVLPDIDARRQKEINEQLVGRVLDFGEKVIEGKPVTDWLGFGSQSLWHYHRFRVYMTLRNLSYLIERIDALPHREKVIYSTDDLLSEYYAHREDIRVNLVKVKNRPDMGKVLPFGIMLVFRLIQSLFQRVGEGEQSILVIDHKSAYRFILELDARDHALENPYWGYLWQRVGARFLDMMPAPKWSVFRWRWRYVKNLKNRKRLNQERILLPAWFNRQLKNQWRAYAANWKEAYRILGQAHEDAIERMMVRLLEQFHGSARFYGFVYLAFRSFFKKNVFGNLYVLDENNPVNRSVWAAAKDNGIHVTAYQHGSVHRLNLNNLYTPADQARAVQPNQYWVWGPGWKNVLVQYGHYPEQQVQVAGHVRSMVLPALSQSGWKREAVAPATSLPVVLFATQPFRNPDWVRKVAQDVFTAARTAGDVFVWIKPHPSEGNGAFYLDWAGQVGLENVALTPQKQDLYLQLYFCDALVTSFSTVAYEMALFEKPIFLYDPLKEDILEISEWILPCSSVDMLIKSFENLNKKEIPADIYGEMRERFIQRFNPKFADERTKR